MNRGTIVRNDIIYSGEKDKVSYISEQIEGTKIGTLTINGVDNDIIAPKGGGEGGASSWQDLENKPFETLSDNFKVEDGILDIDGDFGSKVEASATLTEGNKIGSITIDDNDPVNFYSPEEITEITKAEYDKLTEEERKNKTYFIKDWNGLPPSSRVYNGPIGEILSFMGTIAPDNFLICDGSIYSIADYIDLANHINKHFGSFNFFGGDGTTTFAVPDLRGEFLRGTGTNGHADSGNGSAVGVHQNATQMPQIWNYNGSIAMSYVANKGINSANVDKSINKTTASTNETHIIGSNGSGGYEYTHYLVRPTNTSVLYCIRYREGGNGGTISTKGRIDGVVYINNIPVAQSKIIECHMDSVNGNDDTGDGSSNKPFKTWEKAKSLIPMGKCNVNYYFKGNFDAISISNKIGTFHCVDSPTFKKLDFTDCDIMTFGPFTINYSSATTVSSAAYVLTRSNIRAVTGKTTIIGRNETTYDMRGLQADNGSIYVNTVWDGASIEIRNCVRGCTPITGSKVCIHSSKITFTNCINQYETAAGGTYSTT